jgi:hypothetical protein
VYIEAAADAGAAVAGTAVGAVVAVPLEHAAATTTTVVINANARAIPGLFM